MTRQDIIELARKVGITLPAGPFPARGSFTLPELIHLVRTAIEEERDACARICDKVQQKNEDNGAWMWEAKDCSTAIRQRYEQNL